MISGCPCFPGTVTTTNVSGTRYGNRVSLVLADVKSHKVEIWNKWQGQPRFYNSSTKTASSHLQILKVLVCCWCQFVWHNTRNFWNRNQWNMQNKCRNCGVMWYSESLKECFCFPGKNAFGGIRRWYPYPFQFNYSIKWREGSRQNFYIRVLSIWGSPPGVTIPVTIVSRAGR